MCSWQKYSLNVLANLPNQKLDRVSTSFDRSLPSCERIFPSVVAFSCPLHPHIYHHHNFQLRKDAIRIVFVSQSHRCSFVGEGDWPELRTGTKFAVESLSKTFMNSIQSFFFLRFTARTLLRSCWVFSRAIFWEGLSLFVKWSPKLLAKNPNLVADGTETKLVNWRLLRNPVPSRGR